MLHTSAPDTFTSPRHQRLSRKATEASASNTELRESSEYHLRPYEIIANRPDLSWCIMHDPMLSGTGVTCRGVASAIR